MGDLLDKVIQNDDLQVGDRPQSFVIRQKCFASSLHGYSHLEGVRRSQAMLRPQKSGSFCYRRINASQSQMGAVG